jgi:hypothetical protein
MEGDEIFLFILYKYYNALNIKDKIKIYSASIINNNF